MDEADASYKCHGPGESSPARIACKSPLLTNLKAPLDKFAETTLGCVYSRLSPRRSPPFCSVYLHIMTGLHARGGIAAFLLLLIHCEVTAADIAPAPSPFGPLQYHHNAVHIAPAYHSPPLLPNATAASAEGRASTGSTRPNITANGTHPSLNHWNIEGNTKYVLPLPSKGTPPPNTTAKHGRSGDASPAPKPSLSVNGTQPTAAAKIESVPGFVSTQGQSFMLNGRAAYFAGTNAW